MVHCKAMGRALGAAAVSWVFPGFGHGMTRRRWHTIVWSVLGFLPVILTVLSVWMMWIALAVRLACAIDAFRVVRRDGGAATWFGVLPAIAVVVGSIGIGYAKLSIEQFKIPTSSMYPTIMIGDHVFVDKLSLRWHPPERGELVVVAYPCAPEVSYIKRIVAVGGDTVEVRCNVLYVNGKAARSELVAAHDTYDDHDESSGRWAAREVSRYRETLDDHTYETFHDPDRPRRDASDVLALGDPHDFPRREIPFPPSCHQSGFYDHQMTATQPIGKLVETKPADLAKPCEPQLHFVVPQGSIFGLGDNRSNANDSRYWGVVSTDAVIGRVIGVWLSKGEHGYDWGRVGALH